MPSLWLPINGTRSEYFSTTKDAEDFADAMKQVTDRRTRIYIATDELPNSTRYVVRIVRRYE